MASTSEFVGIDLGTSTSALAHIREDGNPELVPNSDGERLTPSVVYFDQYDDVKLIGSAARDGGSPERTVHHIKRFMDDPDYYFEVDGEQWSPTEISSLILTKLKKDSASIIGEIKDVVLTVPANFNELARSATISAGKMAGLNVTRMVNEPTAAALYYAHTKAVSGLVMVYDLGGGSLDITILEKRGNYIDILLSEGARHLGGHDFDEQIVRTFAKEYRKQKGRELKITPYLKRRLLTLGEDTKKLLSKVKVVTETFSTDNEPITQVTITRDSFEQSIRNLLTRGVMLVEQALDTLQLQPSDIDHVVLVGGSTRIPKVTEILEKQFGKKPLSCGNVDECVALGAALFAQKAMHVSEVCNHSYGTLALIEDAATGVASVQNSVVIPKNSRLPCSMSQTYQTSRDDERLIEIEITQGEDPDPRYVDVIGKISLDVPPNRPAGSEVTVTFSYDVNQRVHAEIYDSHSGLKHNVPIQYTGKGVLTEDEIQRKSAYLKQIQIA